VCVDRGSKTGGQNPGVSQRGKRGQGGRREKRWVLRVLRKEKRDEIEGGEVRAGGKEFQMEGAEKEKERRPSSESIRGMRR
jgi:hypothetical protein